MKFAPIAAAVAVIFSTPTLSIAEVYGWEHEIVAPRDLASGLPTNNRSATVKPNKKKLKLRKQTRSATVDQADKKRPPMVLMQWGTGFPSFD